MERDLIVERTRAGLARSKGEGKLLGRPPKTTPAQHQAIVQGYAAKQSIIALARLHDVSRSTIFTIVKARLVLSGRRLGWSHDLVTKRQLVAETRELELLCAAG